MCVADQTGVTAEVLAEFINEHFPHKMWKNYGDRITSDNFVGAGGFLISGGIKDTR
jgi:hypothetical protein